MTTTTVVRNISVIICTCNRAASLRQTLDSFCRLELPPSLTWELIVVDNNSTDTTRDVCEQFKMKLPLRHVYETRPGVSKARNCGVSEAGADLIAFADDDVTLDPHWISAYREVARLHPEAMFFGGKILPEWQGNPPSWLVKHSPTMLKGLSVHFDLNTNDNVRKASFFGANMAFRRKIFDDGWRFRDDLGVTPDQHILGEESEFMRSLIARGCIGLYVPMAVVYHRMLPGRMTEKYVRHWFRGLGMTRVCCNQIAPVLLVFGAPLVVWLKLMWYSTVYGLTRWTLPSGVWLRAETKMATCLGIIQEFRRGDGKGEGTENHG